MPGRGFRGRQYGVSGYCMVAMGMHRSYTDEIESLRHGSISCILSTIHIITEMGVFIIMYLKVHWNLMILLLDFWLEQSITMIKHYETPKYCHTLWILLFDQALSTRKLKSKYEHLVAMIVWIILSKRGKRQPLFGVTT